MRKNRTDEDIRDAMFRQPAFWAGCAWTDEYLAAQEPEDSKEYEWLTQRRNRRETLADNPNARRTLEDW